MDAFQFAIIPTALFRGTFSQNIATWSRTRGWSDLGGDSIPGEIRSLARDAKTRRIFAVGSSATFVFLVMLDGTSWQLVSELTTRRTVLNVVRIFGGWVYVGGVFEDFGGEVCGNVVRIRTIDFAVDSLNAGVSGPVFEIIQYDNETVIVGGQFAQAGVPYTEVNGLAAFSESSRSWSAFHVFQPVFNSSCAVRSLDANQNGDLLVGGFFKSVGNFSVAVNNIALYSGGRWKSVGPPSSDAPLRKFSLQSVLFDNQANVLAFGFAGTREVGENVLAVYMESEGWLFGNQALLQAGKVSCASLSKKYGVAVGGSFVSNGVAATHSLALWDGHSISKIGPGVSGTLSGLDFVGDSIAVVGSFWSQVDATQKFFGLFNMKLERWTFPSLNLLGVFVAQNPFRVVHVVGDRVFIGGSFDALSLNMSHLAVFDLSKHAFGSVGPSSAIWSLSSTVWGITDNSTHLFVVGQFTLYTSVGVFFNLACLDLESDDWVPISKTCDAGCEDDVIRTVAWSNHSLYVGGNFTFIGPGIRIRADNVAILRDEQWVQNQPGIPGVIIKTLTVVQNTLVCGGSGFAGYFDAHGLAWVNLSDQWRFSSLDVDFLLPVPKK